MSKIALVAGHTLTGTGSGTISGIYNESVCTREVCDILNKYISDKKHMLNHEYHFVITEKSSDYLTEQVTYINGHNFDYAIQFHFNSNEGEPASGTEVWEWVPSQAGKTLSLLISTALGLDDRGVKDGKSKSYKFLKLTKMKSFLVEICFLNNEKDMMHYNGRKQFVINNIMDWCERVLI